MAAGLEKKPFLPVSYQSCEGKLTMTYSRNGALGRLFNALFGVALAAAATTGCAADTPASQEQSGGIEQVNTAVT
jgi:hypothetical protein